MAGTHLFLIIPMMIVHMQNPLFLIIPEMIVLMQFLTWMVRLWSVYVMFLVSIFDVRPATSWNSWYWPAGDAQQYTNVFSATHHPPKRTRNRGFMSYVRLDSCLESKMHFDSTTEYTHISMSTTVCWSYEFLFRERNLYSINIPIAIQTKYLNTPAIENSSWALCHLLSNSSKLLIIRFVSLVFVHNLHHHHL